MKIVKIITVTLILCLFGLSLRVEAVQFDAPYYGLQKKHAAEWAKEDKAIDAKLAALEKKFGKKPNIVYILLDDMGFGEYGIPALNKIRGGRTPNIDRLASQGVTFTRMYTENICTPTRAAFMTGRYAVRTGMEVTKVTPPEGVGLNGKEVTIAELLSDAGYATHHIGKWHLGDNYPMRPSDQGFDESLYMEGMLYLPEDHPSFVNAKREEGTRKVNGRCHGLESC